MTLQVGTTSACLLAIGVALPALAQLPPPPAVAPCSVAGAPSLTVARVQRTIATLLRTRLHSRREVPTIRPAGWLHGVDGSCRAVVVAVLSGRASVVSLAWVRGRWQVASLSPDIVPLVNPNDEPLLSLAYANVDLDRDLDGDGVPKLHFRGPSMVQEYCGEGCGYAEPESNSVGEVFLSAGGDHALWRARLWSIDQRTEDSSPGSNDAGTEYAMALHRELRRNTTSNAPAAWQLFEEVVRCPNFWASMDDLASCTRVGQATVTAIDFSRTQSFISRADEHTGEPED